MSRTYKHVGIVNYPTVQMAAVHGLTDMLTTANQFNRKLGKKDRPLFSVTHWVLNASKDKLEPGFTDQVNSPPKQHIVVVPGSMDPGTLNDLPNAIFDWVRAQYDGGAIAASICKGAFVLAQSGILENRIATTHWAVREKFLKQYPNVQLQIDKIIVDDGDIITAAGVMAWLDLGLRLIHQYSGPEVMLATAKFLLIDPSGREQKFYRAFNPHFDHGDEFVVKAQHWLQAHFSDPVSLAQLAHASATSVRTLIRRFQSALDMSPTTYIQKLRVGKARELLEFSTMAVTEIAWAVGYSDPASFRKIFQRELGLSPGQYRERFNTN